MEKAQGYCNSLSLSQKSSYYPTKKLSYKTFCTLQLYYLNICRYDAGFDNLDLICTRTLQDQVLNAICVLLATAARFRLNENYDKCRGMTKRPMLLPYTDIHWPLHLQILNAVIAPLSTADNNQNKILRNGNNFVVSFGRT